MNTQSVSEAALAAFESGKALALVVMMDQSGSVPRTAGARMLVGPEGVVWGTVGGGRYEAEAISLAKGLLRRAAREVEKGGMNLGAVLEYSLKGVTDMDMICGGALSLLLEALPADARSRELFSAALEAERKHQPFVFVTRFVRDEEGDIAGLVTAEDGVPLEQGAACGAAVQRRLYLPESKTTRPAEEELPAEAVAAAEGMSGAAPHHFALGGDEYLLELFDRPFRLVVFGGGHVSLELAKLVKGVDFPVVVLDDRAEFANSERFPGARVIVPPSLGEEDAAACLKSLHVGPRDGIVIVTRGHAHDRDALAAALATEAGYIGMIGSRSKRAAVYKSMTEKGFSKERIDFVRSPIGIAIGADTPQEIAVSIAAELIQWRKSALDAEESARRQNLRNITGCAKK